MVPVVNIESEPQIQMGILQKPRPGCHKRMKIPLTHCFHIVHLSRGLNYVIVPLFSRVLRGASSWYLHVTSILRGRNRQGMRHNFMKMWKQHILQHPTTLILTKARAALIHRWTYPYFASTFLIRSVEVLSGQLYNTYIHNFLIGLVTTTRTWKMLLLTKT